jgi:hypothetical protein
MFADAAQSSDNNCMRTALVSARTITRDSSNVSRLLRKPTRANSDTSSRSCTPITKQCNIALWKLPYDSTMKDFLERNVAYNQFRVLHTTSEQKALESEF